MKEEISKRLEEIIRRIIHLGNHNVCITFIGVCKKNYI